MFQGLTPCYLCVCLEYEIAAVDELMYCYFFCSLVGSVVNLTWLEVLAFPAVKASHKRLVNAFPGLVGDYLQNFCIDLFWG